jgi:hypothetical protein
VEKVFYVEPKKILKKLFFTRQETGKSSRGKAVFPIPKYRHTGSESVILRKAEGK